MSAAIILSLQESRTNLSPQKMSRGERLLLGIVTIGIAFVMLLARSLTPDPRGFGSHQQLGFPPCAFLTATGLKCPHCGMTTSFCWFVRGEWRHSWSANPAGTVLAVLVSIVWPLLIVMCLRGTWAGLRAPGLTFLLIFAGWLLLSLVIWILRLTG